MRVALVSHTVEPVVTAAAAALRCTHDGGYGDIVMQAVGDPEGILGRVTASGHDSVLEHAVFTFSVEGISRVASHQLVRHRLASYSQQSQRYVPGGSEWVLPVSIDRLVRKDPVVGDMYDIYRNAVRGMEACLRSKGVPEEDIRYLYPQGSATNLVVTMNLRELSHFCGLRRCTRAQEEIRGMADLMADCVAAHFPELRPYLVPQCVRLKYCPERKGCGLKPSLDGLITEKALLAAGSIRERIEDDDIGEGEE